MNPSYRLPLFGVLIFMLSLSLLVLPAVAEPALFKVGRAQQCITPPLGVQLAGYFHIREAKSVYSDLFARAVVIESGNQRVALVSCDLISMTGDVSDPAKALIEAECGIPAANIMICSTHTHTGPEMRSVSNMKRDEEWTAALPGHIAAAVAAAVADYCHVAPANFSYCSGVISIISIASVSRILAVGSLILLPGPGPWDTSSLSVFAPFQYHTRLASLSVTSFPFRFTMLPKCTPAEYVLTSTYLMYSPSSSPLRCQRSIWLAGPTLRTMR